MLMSLSPSRHAFLAGLLALLTPTALSQGVSQITVHADHPGPKISPTFYGLMTEEINHAYDGGLYAELIQNRSLRDNATTPVHWSLVNASSHGGSISLETDPADGSKSLLLSIAEATPNRVGVTNDGYWGIPVWPNTTYHATFSAKASSDFKGPLTVDIESADGATIQAQAKVVGLTNGWREYSVVLRTGKVTASAENRFVISSQNHGSVWFRSVSLFPPTYKHRANGNRIDLMEKLAEMKPSFLRLPGGNYLEGDTIDERFDWKATIGNVADRKGHQGPWRYRSSDGLGLLEFLEWCEDLHMKTVLAVFAGYALRGAHIDPGPKLEPFVQDALDEIEYATGDATTKWGARRIQDGHPKPFSVIYVEIGNEDSFDRSGSYDGRFAQFYDAIKAKYPRMQIIATEPVHSRKPDVVDDHYYRSAAEMERDSGHYDKSDRRGPKIFVGEWASIEGRPTPTHQAALGDAAWLIGLERNSDLVVMEAYAPLLVNVNPRAAQWPTNLIGYDAINSFGSPSFYVQSMFAKNTGDTVLPVNVTLASSGPAKPFMPHGAIGLGTWRTDAEYKDVEVTHDGRTLYHKDFALGTDDWAIGRGTWKVEDGSLRQSSNREDTHATVGDATWTDYTYHVKARQLSGPEGFLILFHVENNRDYWQWNIGGWGNTRSAIQRHDGGSAEEVGEATDTKIEPNRWYDIKIDVHGSDIKCYLDDKLITEVTETPHPVATALYAGASRASSSGEIILKIVNVSSDSLSTQVNLEGVGDVASTGSGWELTGKPDDQNSVTEPKKVFPHPITVQGIGKSFTRTYPPYSVTVLRVKTRR